MSFQEQLAAVHWEMTEGPERRAGAMLRGATTAEQAGGIVSRYYERPLRTQAEALARGRTARGFASGFAGMGGTAGGAGSTGGWGEGRVLEAQAAATRNLPITPQLRGQLETATAAAGVEARVFSGGQPAIGTSARRVGSTRHDLGRSADVKLYDPAIGRTLDMRDPADAARMAQFTEEAVAAGATGVGAGQGYMGPSSIHVGGGKLASWGGAPWIKGAHERGLARQGEPINVSMEPQPGGNQLRRSMIRRGVDREVREAGWNAYADIPV